MKARNWIALAAIVAALIGAFVVIQFSTTPSQPELLIRQAATLAPEKFPNLESNVLRHLALIAYELKPLDLRGTAKIQEGDVAQLQALSSSSSWTPSKCERIEFVSEAEAIVTTRTVIATRTHWLFRKNGKEWNLIHRD